MICLAHSWVGHVGVELLSFTCDEAFFFRRNLLSEERESRSQVMLSLKFLFTDFKQTAEVLGGDDLGDGGICPLSLSPPRGI